MKSQFRFSKNQRYGIFLLVGVILTLRALTWWWGYNTYDAADITDEQLDTWRAELDSLASVNTAAEAPELYPFNPNFISDYKGYSLGMSLEEIDRLKAHRAKGLWINNKEEFKKVTGVSENWLDSIAPFFKFPQWLTSSKASQNSGKTLVTFKKVHEKIDLNTATAEELQRVYGIGPTLSKRIITYRSALDGGFAHEIELLEVYGIDEPLVEAIKMLFTVKTPREIEPIDINKATTEELVTIPYIDYEVAYNIIEYRTLHEGIFKIEELTKIQDFPENKIKLIGLYLQF